MGSGGEGTGVTAADGLLGGAASGFCRTARGEALIVGDALTGDGAGGGGDWINADVMPATAASPDRPEIIKIGVLDAIGQKIWRSQTS